MAEGDKGGERGEEEERTKIDLNRLTIVRGDVGDDEDDKD